MVSLQERMKVYRKQLEKGEIIDAYRGLMAYFQDLRLYFKKKYPDYFVSGIYYGYMDMTYFAFSPESLKKRKLKIAIVFVHEKFRFEAWLSGYTRDIQAKYLELITESGWDKYRTTDNVDSIIERTLVDEPDFDDLEAITEKIEGGALEFIEDVNVFLGSNSLSLLRITLLRKQVQHGRVVGTFSFGSGYPRAVDPCSIFIPCCE